MRFIVALWMEHHFVAWHRAYLHSLVEEFGIICPLTCMFYGRKEEIGWLLWKIKTKDLIMCRKMLMVHSIDGV